MGIKGLFPFIRENAPKAVQEISSAQNYNGRILAIDASTSLYQFLVAIRSGSGESYNNLTNDKGEITSHLSGFLNRTVKLLEAGAKPVYVFDGKPPSLKSGEMANRKARKAAAAEEYEKAKEAGDAETMQKMADRNVTVSKEVVAQTKRLLTLMGIPVVEAPCEAEATCAHLTKTGNAYAAATEDADALCFGAKRMVRNLFTTDVKKKPILEIELERVLQQLDIDMDKFLDFCILCGCDYADTITGVGSITAIQLIKEHKNIDTILEKAVSKEKVPENFPYEEARGLFKGMEVVNVQEIDDSTGKLKYDFSEHFKNKPRVDMAGMKQLMIEENQFNEERIIKSLEKLQKALDQGMPVSFDSFFTIEAPEIKTTEKFDPFKKRGGGKRVNLTGRLVNNKDSTNSNGGANEPAKKKRKGALTADKIEKENHAGYGGNGGQGAASSSGSGGGIVDMISQMNNSSSSSSSTKK